MKKKKIFNMFLKQATEMINNVPDKDLSTLEGLQNTMNQFLNSQGLPSVSIPGAGVPEFVPEVRTFEEIENDYSDLFNDSCNNSLD